MNDNKNIYDQKEVQNKLQNFQEGKDYFVTPSQEPEIKDYTFFNQRLKSLFGGNNWIPVRVWQEKYEDEKVKYRGHFEEGKDYRYSTQHWDYRQGYQGERGIENMPDWMRSAFADRQEGITNHSKVEVYGKSGNFHSGETYWEGRWTYQGKKNEYEYGQRVVVSPSPQPKKPKRVGSAESNEVAIHQNYLTEFQEWKHFWEMRLIEENGGKGSEYLRQKYGENYSTSSARKEIIQSIKESINEYETKTQYEKDWLAQNANDKEKVSQPSGNFYVEWEADDKAKKTEKPELEKENSELRRQLASVQADLAKVLAELKKLTGKNEVRSKLEQQQAHNERVMEEGSAVKMKEQVAKSQALVRESTKPNTTTPEPSQEPQSSSLPYLIGGGSLLVVGVVGVIVASWMVKNKNKVNK